MELLWSERISNPQKMLVVGFVVVVIKFKASPFLSPMVPSMLMTPCGHPWGYGKPSFVAKNGQNKSKSAFLSVNFLPILQKHFFQLFALS